MRILFIQNRPLFPADTGGKIRTLNVLRHLARWHTITYLCNAAPGDEDCLRRMEDLGLRVNAVVRPPVAWGTVSFYRQMARNAVSRVPFNVARHYDRRVRAAARALITAEEYDLVVCDFLQTALHARGLTGPKRVLFQHNVEAQILKRHAETAGRGLRGRYMDLQHRRMRRFEAETGRTFDAVVAVSETDREVFERAYGWPHVRVIDTGVDVDYFRPTPAPTRDGRVLFLGSMDWLPNQDGVQYFVREMWPLIRRARPDASFQVVGRNPPASIRALGAVPGVEVVGTVPDVRPYLAEAAVVVVPLRVGGGTRLKIFEAMAAGKPVVSSKIGCEGLPVEAGRHLLVEDSPAGSAAAVTRLLGSPAEQADLGAAARRLVAGRYGSEAVARQFDRICRDVVGHGKAARSRRAVPVG